MSYKSYNDQEVQDWWKENYEKAKRGDAKQGKHDKYKFMQTPHGYGIRKQMSDPEMGWDKMPDDKNAKNRINSLKDLDRINRWMSLGDEPEKEKKPEKEKEEPYVMSEKLTKAKERIKAFEDDREKGGPDSSWSGWINEDWDYAKEPTVHTGDPPPANPTSEGFYDNYSAILKNKIKEGMREAFDHPVFNA